MINRYVWGEIDTEGEWHLLKKLEDNTYRVFSWEIGGPSFVTIVPRRIAKLDLKPGMRWRHRHANAVFAITNVDRNTLGTIYYAKASKVKKSDSLLGFLSIIWAAYNPMFNPDDYISVLKRVKNIS